MENTKDVLSELRNINLAYDLSVDRIDKILNDIPDAKVCTPVIGKFSSGKSALINTILGYSRKLLKEDITPETAVPAEIMYDDMDNVRVYCSDDYTDMEVEDYRNTEMDAESVRKVRLSLCNSFLREIPDVMIVDMPGFESGYEIHNRAIDDYLPQSLAYIVSFPADDMVLRSSVGNILKELVLNDMPICVVITKFDKKNDEFDKTLDKLKESLKRFIGDSEVKICYTSSFEGDAEEVKSFLREIQKQSQSILAKKFKQDVLLLLDDTERYLKKALKSSEMSESELAEEEEKISNKLNGLEGKFTNEKDGFEQIISDSIDEVSRDVESALNSEESTLITMILNKQNIKDHINTLVRNTVTTSVKKRFIPKVEKYLKKVEKCINGDDIGDVDVNLQFDAQEIGSSMAGPIVAVIAGLVLEIPVIGLIVAGISALIGKVSADKKREQQKEEVRSKLRSEVFPQIIKEVENGLKIAITKQMTAINTSIEEEIVRQKDTLNKAMTDVKSRMADEKEKKDNFIIDLNNDLLSIEELRSKLV